MTSLRHSGALSLLILAAALGCGKSRIEELSDRADAYNRSLRWSSLTAASALIAEEVRRTMIVKLAKELGSNRIVDYSIVDLGVDAKASMATVVVEFSYYNIARNDLKYRQEVQTWDYDTGKKDWFLREVRPVPESN